MRRIIGILWIVCFVSGLLAGLTGCAALQDALSGVKDQTREIVGKADDLATENEAIVEQLVFNRQSVTEDQEVIAIRNARALKVLTGALADVVGPGD